MEQPENRTVWKSDNQGVKEETFIQTSRRGGDGQLGWRGLAARQHWWTGWGSGSQSRVPRLRVDKLGARQTAQPRVPARGNKASKPLTEKICGCWGGRISSQPQRRVHWREPQGPRTHTKPPTQESAPEGPNVLVGSTESDWKPAESQASGIVPSWTPPPHRVPQCRDVGCPTLVSS